MLWTHFYAVTVKHLGVSAKLAIECSQLLDPGQLRLWSVLCGFLPDFQRRFPWYSFRMFCRRWGLLDPTLGYIDYGCSWIAPRVHPILLSRPSIIAAREILEVFL